MIEVKRVDGNSITEQEAQRRFGKPMADFMKAVAKASKKYKIDAYALWMYHHSAMRVCSSGVDDTGRSIGKKIALMMADHNEALMEDMAREIEGEPDK